MSRSKPARVGLRVPTASADDRADAELLEVLTGRRKEGFRQLVLRVFRPAWVTSLSV
jgi:hypothetical protein